MRQTPKVLLLNLLLTGKIHACFSHFKYIRPVKKFILKLRICILRLGIYILNLRIHIFRLRINFSMNTRQVHEPCIQTSFSERNKELNYSENIPMRKRRRYQYLTSPDWQISDISYLHPKQQTHSKSEDFRYFCTIKSISKKNNYRNEAISRLVKPHSHRRRT